MTAEPLERSFSYFCDSLSKSEETIHGAKLRIVEGISTVQSPDQMGETLLTKGMDFAPFLERGFLNWDHQDSRGPEYIIGEPLAATDVTHKGYPAKLVRGFLYDDHEKADACWKLMNTLEDLHKVGRSTRQIGMSVQGSTLQRVGYDVPLSVVRHVAMTHQPVHPDTSAAPIYRSFSEFAKSLTVGSAATIPLLRENLAGPQNAGQQVRYPNLSDLLEQHLWGGCNGGHSHMRPDGSFKNGRGGAMEHLVLCRGTNPQDAAQSLYRLHRSGIAG